MRITPAVLGDLGRLVEIESAAFDPAQYTALTRRQFRHHIASERAILLIARADEGVVVGYALGLTSGRTRYVRFYSLAAHPSVQGGEVGRLLFSALEEAARARGLGVQCEIRQDNTKLLQRYEALGYRPYRRIPGYYPDGETCIKLKRDLAQSEAGGDILKAASPRVGKSERDA